MVELNGKASDITTSRQEKNVNLLFDVNGDGDILNTGHVDLTICGLRVCDADVLTYQLT